MDDFKVVYNPDTQMLEIQDVAIGTIQTLNDMNALDIAILMYESKKKADPYQYVGSHAEREDLLRIYHEVKKLK